MQVETYEIEEVKGEMGNLAADSEACELIKKLGLEGQQKLLEPGSETRFPYPRLTKQQALVFKTLCPEQTEIAKYHSGIIPLRVLQVAAFCREMPQSGYLEVWHPEDWRDDPVLIGRKAPYEVEAYLLARWGETLLPLEKLIEKARPLLRAKTLAKLKEISGECANAIAGIDDLVESSLCTGKEIEPYFGGI